ncbi:hypothetical protein PVW51_07075 [Sulfitobacter sp. PR48]|uniref:Uncharacterized protein n=1 Tax=Sulfitobacter porphyrae TaxID=1246864 RepID=A0ABW2B5J3_9RHOB|nr:hypothetical protein [Sulfitobacter sp. PR48]MDD9720448.1 hypothetical protein [Sulfitobacter sp. PR48]
MEQIKFSHQPVPDIVTVDQCPLGDAGIACRVRGKAAEIRKVAA